MYLDSFKDPFKLWQEKTGRWVPVPEREGPEESAMQRGHRLEPDARNLYCEQQGIFAPPVCIEAEGEDSFLACSLDGLVESGWIIEIKCPRDARTHLDALEGQIPDKYWLQIQHNMHVAQVNRCDYVSYFPESTQQLAVLTLSYDDKFIHEEYLPVAREFWQAVENDSYPEPDWQEELQLSAGENVEVMKLTKAYLDYRRMREEAQAHEDHLMGQLKRKLSAVGAAVGPGVRFQWERRRGFLNYRSIPEVQSFLRNAGGLEQFRGPDSYVLKVSRS
jgi:putative phage-type endonuclease